jgi:hypothetical protein
MYELLRLRHALLTVLSSSLLYTPAVAEEIYKWVDEHGATHYGETLPTGDVASVEVLEVTPAAAPLQAAPRDYRSTLDIANRMQADRLERERLRLEREKLRQQQREAEFEQQRFNDTYPPAAYGVPYYGYPRRPYPRPPYYGKYPGYPSPPYGQHPPGRYRAPDVPKRVYLDRP